MHRLIGFVCLLLVLWGADPARAQLNDESVKPDNIVLLETKHPVIEYVIAGGSLVGALLIGFMPSKRVQD